VRCIIVRTNTKRGRKGALNMAMEEGKDATYLRRNDEKICRKELIGSLGGKCPEKGPNRKGAVK